MAPVPAMQEFLKSVRQMASLHFTLLLSLRFEYMPHLKQIGVPTFQQGINWQAVQAFRESDASEFLSAKETGFEIHGERLQHVLREAAAVDGTPRLIRPIILNMLGVVLRRIAGTEEAERPTRTLLADEVQRVVNGCSHRDVARPVLSRMLTDADTKHRRTIGELRQETGLDARVVEGCLLDLELSGYVRPLSHSGELETRVWEISHDFVARLLGPILKVPIRTFWQRASAALYPLSFAAWLLFLGFGPSLAKWVEVKLAESALVDMDMGHRFCLRRYPRGISADRWDKDMESEHLEEALRLLAKVPGLDLLALKDCTDLTTLDGPWENLKDLQTLDLSGCTGLTNVASLGKLPSLDGLQMWGCTNVTDLTGLGGIKHLRSLWAGGCLKLRTLNGIEGATNLTYLNVDGCSGLTNWHALGQLKKLDSFSAHECDWTNLNNLKHSTSVQTLHLVGCAKLQRIDGIEDFNYLHGIYLNGCRALTNVDVLLNLTNNLRMVDLSGCRSLDGEAVRRLKRHLPSNTTIREPHEIDPFSPTAGNQDQR